MTIDDYMDAAISHCGATSDRGLARAAGIAPATVSWWRTKRAWPSDEQMIKLAELADIDPERAILELNIWRTKSPAAASVYEDILLTVSKAAIAIIILCLTFTYHALANASGTADHYSPASIYYGK